MGISKQRIMLPPPLAENGELEDFVGLTVKNPIRFEGVGIEEDTGNLKPPNRADDNRFLDFKETKIASAWQGLF